MYLCYLENTSWIVKHGEQIVNSDISLKRIEKEQIMFAFIFWRNM